MAVKYSLVQRIKPGDPSAPRKYYAVAQTTGSVTLRQLSKQIAEMSTVSPIDALAVMESLIQVLPDHLLNGKIVRLGELGAFRLTLSSEGVENADDFNKSLIKKVKLLFRPGKLISTKLKTANYEKI